ncbi:nuclear transport factor 2 family protein [Novosphingobium sp. FSY-8]|uniref:Nuclear transport factor 2 family protein n=1 Tax=Novosphingobium ovatum TaxID=1908523 RepID=A0ABW9XD17_9SPHN|nr:nuclear transport factor 2 family protein [Novosphingobium ovatum]NBC36415.1 nuclear transport factor 2 family protein [Novosphingobium ovatum]
MITHTRLRWLSAPLLALAANAALAAPAAAPAPAPDTSAAQIAALQAEVGQLRQMAANSQDRAAVENLFSRYMYLHNAFQDTQIIPLWAKKGTPGVRSQYSNLGVYTDWDKIISYHQGRPTPVGKLVFHYVTTPLIEIAGDGQTAKGLWIVNGLESGLMAPEIAAKLPAWMFEKTMVNGKKVWMHNVYIKYGIDFIKQDGEWKIWHFHCFEVARAPYGMGWIPFAAAAQDDAFNVDLMYIGEDGKPVMMPKTDGPATVLSGTYRTDAPQRLDARPPVPFRTFSETFEY